MTSADKIYRRPEWRDRSWIVSYQQEVAAEAIPIVTTIGTPPPRRILSQPVVLASPPQIQDEVYGLPLSSLVDRQSSPLAELRWIQQATTTQLPDEVYGLTTALISDRQVARKIHIASFQQTIVAQLPDEVYGLSVSIVQQPEKVVIKSRDLYLQQSVTDIGAESPLLGTLLDGIPQRRARLADIFWPPIIVTSEPAPGAQLDWPNPIRQNYPVELRSWVFTILPGAAAVAASEILGRKFSLDYRETFTITTTRFFAMPYRQTAELPERNP